MSRRALGFLTTWCVCLHTAYQFTFSHALSTPFSHTAYHPTFLLIVCYLTLTYIISIHLITLRPTISSHTSCQHPFHPPFQHALLLPLLGAQRHFIRKKIQPGEIRRDCARLWSHQRFRAIRRGRHDGDRGARSEFEWGAEAARVDSAGGI